MFCPCPMTNALAAVEVLTRRPIDSIRAHTLRRHSLSFDDVLDLVSCKNCFSLFFFNLSTKEVVCISFSFFAIFFVLKKENPFLSALRQKLVADGTSGGWQLKENCPTAVLSMKAGRQKLSISIERGSLMRPCKRNRKRKNWKMLERGH